MIRILQSVSNMDRGGIETMLMNYYRHMDRTLVQFDFLANKSKPGNYNEEIRALGGRIFLSPGLNPLHYPQYIRFMKELLAREKDIRVLHAHNEAMGLYALRGAKAAGLQARIAHAHNTCIVRDYKWPLKMLCKPQLADTATALWGCGRDAGIYFFGKKNWEARGMIVHNAIELDRFRFDPETRARMRREYGLDGHTVIGHVGRFNVQKNHSRLLDIFAAYLHQDASALLLLLGEGELETTMKQKAQQLGIAESVRFTGLQSNVNEWYQAMDMFVMPSLFEGLPVVGVEAQASGLPCLFSDAVTDEVALSAQAKRLSLQADDGAWAKALLDAGHTHADRAEGESIVRRAGYDICQEATRIQNLYLTMAEQ